MASWEMERRLDYIDWRMLIMRWVRREDIMRTFGVSMPRASKDINEFIRLYPESLWYDKTGKRYVPMGDPYEYTTKRGNTREVLGLLGELALIGHPFGWR